jgi:hypothetical protein
MPKPTQVERFWRKVEKSNTCWMWIAGTDNHGYGLFWVDGRIVKAHRFAYELLIGPIPQDRVIDHICGTRLCMNPDHLRLVTVAQNNQNRKANRGTSTGVRGVTLKRGRYRVAAQLDGVKYNAGSFATLPEAERAAIALRDRLMTHNDHDRK